MELLKRQIGIWGAVWLGLGSILGTGVFVSIATATEVAGTGVLIAITIGAGVAVCNGLNSAQLAASHPVSGGTYEYGYRYLNGWLGFTAGWLFLLAKSASAATAALGLAYYLQDLGINFPPRLVAPLAVVIITIVVFWGIKRSSWINTAIVAVTLVALMGFIGLGLTISPGEKVVQPFNLSQVLQATALMFVAYTGYGRIATLGEEVTEPKRTIPLAIWLTLGISMAIYLGVGGVGIWGGIVKVLPSSSPLADLTKLWGYPLSSVGLSIGAVTAMAGVLLNLILGLSRIVLAMGRRKDLPQIFAQLNPDRTNPPWAVGAVGVGIVGLTLLGNVKTTWSFSAFNVLIYYAITNGAALQLPPEERLFPKWLGGLGLIACAFLAFWVEWQIWLGGLGLIAAGTLLRWLTNRTKVG